MGWSGRAPCLWRTLPASLAGGAGVRPDHPINGLQQSQTFIVSDPTGWVVLILGGGVCEGLELIALKRAFGASVRCYPSLPIAFLTWCGIDFSAGLDWLRDRGKSSATACRTSNLSRVRGWGLRRLLHCDLSRQTAGRSMFGRRLFRLGPGNVRRFQPTRSHRLRNPSRSLTFLP